MPESLTSTSRGAWGPHSGGSEGAPPGRYRAAYRNRTDDLFITSETTDVHRGPDLAGDLLLDLDMIHGHPASSEAVVSASVSSRGPHRVARSRCMLDPNGVRSEHKCMRATPWIARLFEFMDISRRRPVW
jgi:hypothetical protein